MFQIGDFSRISRLPVSMLRYYADIGLLEPHHVDPSTNYRYYSLDQLPRLNRILALKDLGLSLDEIAQILQENLPSEQIRGMLRLKEAEIDRELSAAQDRLVRVAARLEHIEKEGEMPGQEVVLKTIESIACLSIRQTVPSGEHVGYLLGESAQAAIANGAELAGAPFVIFHDEEFKPADLDVEVVFPVKGSEPQEIELEIGGRLVASRLPGIKAAACVLHLGPYENFPQTYAALGRWIEANGYRMAGAVREVYLRPPGEVGEAITEIQFPVEKV